MIKKIETNISPYDRTDTESQAFSVKVSAKISIFESTGLMVDFISNCASFLQQLSDHEPCIQSMPVLWTIFGFLYETKPVTPQKHFYLIVILVPFKNIAQYKTPPSLL